MLISPTSYEMIYEYAIRFHSSLKSVFTLVHDSSLQDHTMSLPWMYSFIVVLVVFISTVCCDIYTSTAHMRQLVHLERHYVLRVEEYLEAERKRLDTISR